MIHCIYALVLGLNFCVKIFRFMLDFLTHIYSRYTNIFRFFFFFSHFPFISMWRHIDPEVFSSPCFDFWEMLSNRLGDTRNMQECT